MRRYGMLLAVLVALGALLARVGTHRAAAVAAGAAPHAVATVHLPVRIESAGLTPARASVAAGTHVELSIENATPRTVRVALSGYEDRVTLAALAPGGRWTATLVADRPGDDFAWLVDGAPTGRFVVTGSHLVDGDR